MRIECPLKQVGIGLCESDAHRVLVNPEKSHRSGSRKAFGTGNRRNAPEDAQARLRRASARPPEAGSAMAARTTRHAEYEWGRWPCGSLSGRGDLRVKAVRRGDVDPELLEKHPCIDDVSLALRKEPLTGMHDPRPRARGFFLSRPESDSGAAAGRKPHFPTRIGVGPRAAAVRSHKISKKSGAPVSYSQEPVLSACYARYGTDGPRRRHYPASRPTAGGSPASRGNPS